MAPSRDWKLEETLQDLRYHSATWSLPCRWKRWTRRCLKKRPSAHSRVDMVKNTSTSNQGLYAFIMYHPALETPTSNYTKKPVKIIDTFASATVGIQQPLRVISDRPRFSGIADGFHRVRRRTSRRTSHTKITLDVGEKRRRLSRNI